MKTELEGGDDAQFVARYTQLIQQLDRLHQVQHMSLDDDRIRRLRAAMEGHLARLTTIARTVGHAQQKKAALACRFAQQQLGRFADYKSAAPAKADAKAAPQSAVHSWSAALVKADAKAAPPQPQGAVHSWNAALVTRQPAKQDAPNPIAATKAQRGMLALINNSTSTRCCWSEAPFAALPADLWPSPEMQRR